MAEKKEKAVEEVTTLGPKIADGEEYFAVAHIFASFNDTFVHVTDLSGRETLSRVTGGMKVKADRDEASPYAAMLAAMDVAAKVKELGVTAVHIKIRATGLSSCVISLTRKYCCDFNMHFYIFHLRISQEVTVPSLLDLVLNQPFVPLLVLD